MAAVLAPLATAAAASFAAFEKEFHMAAETAGVSSNLPLALSRERREGTS